MPFQCYLQVKKTASRPPSTVLRALCMSTAGPFYVFEKTDQPLKEHTDGIRKAVQKKGTFAEQVHLKYTFNDEEMKTYLTKETNFQFRGKILKERQIASRKPSCKKIILKII